MGEPAIAKPNPTVLLTYPQAAVPVRLRQRLEECAMVSYCPLRTLREVAVDDDAARAIASAPVVIITSHTALTAFLRHWWASDWTGTLVVLSRKMADAAQEAGVRHIAIPKEEHQHAVAALLRQLPIEPGSAVTLCGNLTVAHDALPAEVRRIQVYENVWDDDEQRRAIASIDQAVRAGGASEPISRVLVTSPSAYRRLQPIREAIPDCFGPSLTYYTLGPSTAECIAADGCTAVVPPTGTDVLSEAIAGIIADIDVR